MDKRNLSSITPSRSSMVPKTFSSDFYKLEEADGEVINENGGQFHEGISPNSKNPRKGAKNFMSPTTSAASKAALPRKKILGERNEAFGSNFSETQMAKSPDLLLKSSQITPSSMKVFESGYSSDSASLPYDPLTNYLSPRPQFLRYKPNRLLEMCLHREGNLKKGEEGLVLEGSIKSQQSIEEEFPIRSRASSQDGSEQQDESSPCTVEFDLKPSDNPETTDSVDEEEKEEKHWLPSFVLKSLLPFGTHSSDSASLPYDPLTNYLSPRPQFLRYKPNMGLEMCLHREGNLKKGEEGLVIEGSTKSQQSIEEEFPIRSCASSQDGSEQQDGSSRCTAKLDLKPSDNPETKESESDDDDVDDEEKEEKHWLPSFVLKSLLIFCILYFFTFYILSPNRPAFQEGYSKLQEPLFQFTEKSRVGVEKISKTNAPYLQFDLEERESYDGATSMILVEETVAETEETDNDLYEAEENEEAALSTCTEQEEANEQSLMEITGTTTDEGFREEDLGELGAVRTREITEILELQDTETTAISDSLQVPPTQFLVDSFAHENTHSTSEKELDEIADTVTDEGIRKEERTEDEIVKPTEITYQMHEISEQGRECSELKSGVLGSFAPSASETELNSGKEDISLLAFMKVQFNSRAVIGLSLISVLAASTILGFLSLKRRKASVTDSSRPPTCQQLPSKLTVLENSSVPEKEEQVLEKGDSYANPSSLVHSNDNYYELYRTHPPTVELLGEYEVGEISFPEKSSDQRSKKGGEEIIFSQSQEKKRSARKSPSFSTHLHPPPSEFSTAESPTYGSFVTSQEKLMRKEESIDRREVMNPNSAPTRNRRGEVLTPVRRSSRIRNRVMSP